MSTPSRNPKSLTNMLDIPSVSMIVRMMMAPAARGGPACLDSMVQFLSGASQWSDYAAVSRVVRLSPYTSSGVLPSNARCGLVWL